MVTIPREFNMDHLKFHLILELGKEREKELNKRNRSGQEEMNKVFWYFMYIKEKALGENYKEAYLIWRERNPMTTINTVQNYC
jgi:hypothetical protein